MLKRKGFILAMAFAGIFCLLCYLFLPGFILSFTDRNIIKKQLIQAVEAAYPVRLRLGDIRYAWGKFELTDVALTSLDGRPLAEIPLMGVELNWFKLAFNPGEPVFALQKLVFHEPRLVIEEANGSYNIQNIFAPGKDGVPVAWPDLTIRVVSGEIQLPKAIQGIEPGSLRKIGAEVQLSRTKLLRFQLASQTTLDEKARLWLEGQFSGETSGGRFLARLQDIPLGLLEEKLSAKVDLGQYGISALTGRGTVEAHGAVTAAGGFSLEKVRIKLAQAGGKWDRLADPVSRLDGEFLIEPDRIRLQGVRCYLGSGLVRINGKIDLENAITKGNIVVEASGLPLKSLSKIHSLAQEGDLNGEADLRLRISGTLAEPAIRGEIRLRDGAFRYPANNWYFNRLDGLVRLDNYGVEIRFLQGKWQEGSWKISGRIRGWEQPVWDLTISGQNLPLAFPDLPVTHGPVSGEVKVSGMLRTPVFAGNLRSDRISWSSWEGHDPTVTGSYETATGLLTLSRIRFRIDDAQVDGNLRIDTRKAGLPYTGKLKVVQLDAAVLQDELPKLLFWPQVQGTYELDLAAAGRLTEVESWEARGELRGKDGRLEEIPFQRMQGYFTWQKQQLAVDYFLLDQGTGRLLMNGTWSADSGLKGEVLAGNLAFTVPVSDTTFKWVKGTASGRIKLQGDAITLSGGGWVDLNDLEYANGPIGDLRLRLVSRGNSLSLDRSRLKLAKGGQIQFEGAVYWEEEVPSLDLTVSTEDLSVQEVASLLPFKVPVELQGKVDTEAKVTGSMFQPELHGKLTAEKMRLAGRLVDRVAADWSWKQGVFSLQEAELRQGGGLVRLSGDFGSDHRLNLAVVAEAFPLEALELKLGGVPIQGKVGLSGVVQGDFAHPVVRGQVVGETVNLAGIVIRRIEGGITWQDQRLEFLDIIADRVEQRVRLNGCLDLAGEPEMDLELNLEATRLSELLLIVGFRPQIPTDGIITGRLQLAGPVSEPRIRILANLDRGYIDGYQKLQGQLEVEICGQVTTIHRIKFTDGEGTLAINGKYSPGRDFALNLAVRNFSLQPLGEILHQPLQGRLDFTAGITAGKKGLSGQLAGKLRAGKWGGIELAQTKLKGNIRDGMLYAELAQEELNLSLRGRGPIKAEWLGFIRLPADGPHQEAPIHWKLVMHELSAGVLGKFFPGAKISGGTVKAEAEVKGTWEKPILAGEMHIKQLYGEFQGLPERFQDLNAEVTLSSKKLEVRQLTSKYGKGTVYATGTIAMNGFSFGEMDLILQARRFHYASSAFEGFVDCHLLLGGTMAKPVLSGEAVINDSRVSIVRAKGESAFNPRLDLQVRTGSNNYFRQFGVANVLAEGELRITGNMKKPVLEGTLTSHRGTLSLYGNKFRLTQAKADFSRKNGYLPELYAEATTRVPDAEIFLTISGWTGEPLDLRFRSVPEKSYEEIISMLHWSEMTDGNSLSLLQGNMNTVIDSLFGSVLERFRTGLGMDYLTLEQDMMMGPFRLNVGKSVSDDLYILYSRTLDESQEDVWSLEYYLMPGISLLSDYSEEEGTKIQLNFNFNF